MSAVINQQDVTVAEQGAQDQHEFRRDEQRQYRLMYVITLAILLPIAAVARLSSWRWQPWPPGSNGYGSFVTEARGMARTLAGYAFRL